MLKAVDEDCNLAAALFRGSLARRRALVVRVLLLCEAFAEDGKEVCDGFAQLDFDDADFGHFEEVCAQRGEAAALRERVALGEAEPEALGVVNRAHEGFWLGFAKSN